jgi:hypothetical protein
VYWATLRPGHDWGGDFSQYINHARNLAVGRPYGETRYVITLPEAAIHMPAVYPPVFPMVLAPVYRRFGLDLVAMKIVVQALFVLAALALYALARLRGVSATGAAAVAGALALSGLVLSFKDMVLSDSTHLLFACMTLCALAAIEKWKWDETQPLTGALVVAIFMLLAYGSRGIGAALPVSVALHEALVRRRVRRFGVAVLVIFAAGVAMLTATLYDSRAYRMHFPMLPAAYLQNATYYAQSVGSLWQDSPAALRYFLLLTTASVASIAWVRRAISRPTVEEFYVATVVAVTVAYSLGRTARYLLPVFALYFIYVCEGVMWLDHRFKTRPWILRAACVMLVAGIAGNVFGMEKGPYAHGVEQSTFTTTCSFIRAHLDRDALIVFWNPRVLALYTDTRSAWYPKTSDVEFDRYLERVAADYVLVDLANEDDRQWLGPHVAHDPARFVPIFSNADFVLYRRSREAAPR